MGRTSSGRRWLLDLEARVAPDVVHLNGYAHGALPCQRAGARGRPLVRALVVEAVGQRLDAAHAWSRYREASRAGIRARADWVAPPSAAHARRAGASTGRFARLGDPERARRTRVPPAERSRWSSRRAGCGTSEERRGRCSRIAAGWRGRYAVAGECDRARRARAMCGLSWPANRRSRMARPRVDLRAAGALRAVRPAAARGGARRAARWCSATSRACARSGATRRSSSHPDDARRAASSALAALIDDAERLRAALARGPATRALDATRRSAWRDGYVGRLSRSCGRAGADDGACDDAS